MIKILNEITDWTGWFFVEAGVRMHDLSDHNWAWDTATEEYHWYMRPWGWLANGLWSIGNYFYGLAWNVNRRRK